jgi:hypothetical protein
LKTQLLEAAIDKFPELLDGRRLIWEQIESCRFVLGNLDRAVVDAIVDEMNRDAQFFGKLGNGEAPVNPARM